MQPPQMPGPERRPGAVDALRLAVGTLTVWPVRPPSSLDRRTAGTAMAIAPLVGLALGGLAALVVAAVSALVAGPIGSLLAAVLAIAVLALATRGLHLDGLADTADALGSARPAQQALDIARRGDTGPFGVTAIVVVLLVQVSALAASATAGTAVIAAVAAIATGRLAATWSCVRGIPAARTEGLGALVAGSVPVPAAIAWTILLAGLAGGGWLLAGGTATGAVLAGASVPLALVAAAVIAVVARRRLGGITGDTLGAAVEATTAIALVALALIGSR